MKTINQSIEVFPHDPYETILKKIELCGRVCYKSENNITEKSAERFVRMLIRRGHESVLEHSSLTIRFITNRAIANELTRHRLLSVSQESTRYVKYDDIEFIKTAIPGEESFFDICEGVYKSGITEGYLPGMMRDFLPLALKTELICTANLREWRHILKVRISLAAHPDMRALMRKVYAYFEQNLPVFVSDMGWEEAIEGRKKKFEQG